MRAGGWSGRGMAAVGETFESAISVHKFGRRIVECMVSAEYSPGRPFLFQAGKCSCSCLFPAVKVLPDLFVSREGQFPTYTPLIEWFAVCYGDIAVCLC